MPNIKLPSRRHSILFIKTKDEVTEIHRISRLREDAKQNLEPDLAFVSLKGN